MPLDSYTKLLAHFNTAKNGSNEMTATTGQTMTCVGTADMSTAQKEFGAGSLLLDGNSDYVTVPDSSDWNRTNPFTIDFWVRFNSVSSTQALIGQRVTDSDAWAISYYTDGGATKYLAFQVVNADGYTNGMLSYCSWSPNINQWYHIAVVRNGTAAGDWYIFIDGVAQSKSLSSGSYAYTFDDLASPMQIGYGRDLSGSASYANCFFDEVRYSSLARWTANFTPPTAEYGAASGRSYAFIL